jgi:hypothetical protein
MLTFNKQFRSRLNHIFQKAWLYPYMVDVFRTEFPDQGYYRDSYTQQAINNNITINIVGLGSYVNSTLLTSIAIIQSASNIALFT